MRQQSGHLSQQSLGLVENAQLAQHSCPVVIDSLPGETVVRVKSVDATERKLDLPPGGRKAAPRAEMRASNKDFDQNGVGCDMLALDLDFEVRQGVHELLVKLADAITTAEVLSPWFVIVAPGVAERAQNTFQVMLVLEANVALDERDARGRSVPRDGRAGHVYLWCSRNPGMDIITANTDAFTRDRLPPQG
jgi:hypothetical protein